MAKPIEAIDLIKNAAKRQEMQRKAAAQAAEEIREERARIAAEAQQASQQPS